VLATSPACAAADDFPGARLRERLEASLTSRKAELQEAPGHYGLVFEIEQADLLEFMTQIRFHRDGGDFVLGVDHAPETHGGGVLALLLDAWRPAGRAARLTDAFPFGAKRQSLELEKIYRGHARQIFLPVPEREADAIIGELPASPVLPRMRFRYWTEPEPFETDAYRFLSLLLTHEDDLAETWSNHLGQELSVDLLLDNARGHYLALRDTGAERADHSHLHLVELLLAYDRRRPSRSGADEIKRRFLEVELARESFEGEDGSEALAHYVESLGVLLADPRIHWRGDEKRRLTTWLRRLERDRIRELDHLPLQHQSHLLRGLRLIAAHRDRLE
jgi:hypothetical protein